MTAGRIDVGYNVRLVASAIVKGAVGDVEFGLRHGDDEEIVEWRGNSTLSYRESEVVTRRLCHRNANSIVANSASTAWKSKRWHWWH
jgi:hypothetical protein